MARSHQIRLVATKLAVGLAAASLLAVPVAATASTPHRSSAHASRKPRRHHRRRRLEYVVRLRSTLPAKPAVPARPPARITPGRPASPTTPPIATNPEFFSPTSIWNQQLSAGAPIDPRSSVIVNSLVGEVSSAGSSVNTTEESVPIYTVDADQRTVPVTIASNPQLSAAMSAVPMPPNAAPAAGNDANLAVWQPSTDTMWEFWRLAKRAHGWTAGWGGVMGNVSADPGYYQNIESRTGAVLQRNIWGAPASSFPLVAGVMTISELESGQIDHALSLAVPGTAAGKWASPAQRTDGQSTAANAIPEGAHFRLNPNINLASLNLPPFVYMMAVAAQKYGIIINNTGPVVAFRAEDPTQFIAQHGYNPYLGPSGQVGSPGALFSDFPVQLMKLFPWNDLQLLQMNLQTQISTTWITQ